jgi:hypothetical protein
MIKPNELRLDNLLNWEADHVGAGIIMVSKIWCIMNHKVLPMNGSHGAGLSMILRQGCLDNA